MKMPGIHDVLQALADGKDPSELFEEDRKEKKRVKFRKEWKPIWQELEKARDARDEAENLRKALHKRFWSQIELDLQEYGDMEYDSEKNEIIIYEN